MKKTVWMLAAALPLMMAACGEDDGTDEPISLDKTVVELNYDAETTLKASDKDCTWRSDNPFVATVDANGKVTAEHVGEAIITAFNSNDKAECKVTVNATNTNFTMPILTWGISKTAVQAAVADQKLGLTEEINNDTQLGFTTGGKFPWYTYAFTNDELKASSLIVSETMDETDDLLGYLEQYYEEYGEDDATSKFFFCDADDVKDATVTLEYGYDVEVGGVMVKWTLPKETKSGKKGFDFSAAKVLKDAALQLKK